MDGWTVRDDRYLAVGKVAGHRRKPVIPVDGGDIFRIAKVQSSGSAILSAIEKTAQEEEWGRLTAHGLERDLERLSVLAELPKPEPVLFKAGRPVHL